MAAPSSKTAIPQKIKDIRKQNNFMSIIETKSKDEASKNPKSQSVLQDYNIKYEKKEGHMKKKSGIESGKTTALSKLIKGHPANYKPGENSHKYQDSSIK